MTRASMPTRIEIAERVARYPASGAVVLYDGECAFCRARCQQLRRLDRRQRLSFISIGDAVVAMRYPELSPAELAREMHVIDARGRVYRGARATRRLCLLLPRLWLFAVLMYIPGSLPLWQWMYRQIAARRYQLSGRSPESSDCGCSGLCPAPARSKYPTATTPRAPTNHARGTPTDPRLEPALHRREHAVG